MVINILVRMDIGSSVAIFLVLALVLLALFCFLTKYFHHRLKQSLEQAAQIYSVVDQISLGSEGEAQGQYQKYKQKEFDLMIKSEKKKKKHKDEVMIEMVNLRTPINSDNDLYNPNALKRRLNSDLIPMKMQTNRSISSLKEFKPDKMITTNRTNRANPDDTKRSLQSQPPKFSDDLTQHTFVNKLVCYDSQGLTVIQVNVSSICKMGEGSIKERKKYKKERIPQQQKNFQTQLEIFGFEKFDYGCYKYETKVEVSNMKLNQDYAIQSLKTCQEKQSIQISEYLRIKAQIQGGI